MRRWSDFIGFFDSVLLISNWTATLIHYKIIHKQKKEHVKNRFLHRAASRNARNKRAVRWQRKRNGERQRATSRLFALKQNCLCVVCVRATRPHYYTQFESSSSKHTERTFSLFFYCKILTQKFHFGFLENCGNFGRFCFFFVCLWMSTILIVRPRSSSSSSSHTHKHKHTHIRAMMPTRSTV